MTRISHALLAGAFSYGEYRSHVDRLLQEGKTTGENHAEQMLEYTRLNVHRMSRIDRTVKLTAGTKQLLAGLDRDLVWLVLTEAWCGDAAQNVPVLSMMADAAPRVTLRLLLRDAHLDIMDRYLTNGGRAIPKLVCLDAGTLAELGTWGPRPEPAQAMVREHKADPQEPYSEFVKKVQLWYARDRGLTIQDEICGLLTQWQTKA